MTACHSLSQLSVTQAAKKVITGQISEFNGREM